MRTWYDPKTTRVKIATHACFDEGFNDLPGDKVNPNVVHLQRTNDNQPLPSDKDDMIHTSTLQFYINPFAHLKHITMKVTKAKHPHFGIKCVNDGLLQRAYIKDIKPNSDAARIASSPKASR